MLILITFGLLLSAFLVSSVIFVTRPSLKFNPENLLIYALCFFITSDWLIRFSGLVVAPIYDLLFVIGVPLLGIKVFQSKILRNRKVQILLTLYFLFQFWFLISLISHNGLSLQPFWSWYRRGFITFIFVLAGLRICAKPRWFQKNVFKFLLLAFLLESAVGIIQTGTTGQIFTDEQNSSYLGFLTPHPNQSNVSPSDLRTGPGLDNGVFVGSIFRAVGVHLQAVWFSVSMTGGVSLAIGGYLYSNSSFNRDLKWLAALTFGFSLIALFFSFARTGYFACFALLIWVWVYWHSKREKINRVSQIALASFVLVPIIMVFIFINGDAIYTNIIDNERFAQLLTPLQSQSVQWRLDIWQFAWNEVLETPLIGSITPLQAYNIFPENYTTDRSLILPLHSQFFSSMYHGGFPLSILYLTTNLWLIFVTTKESKFKYKSINNSLWIIPANLCLIGYFIQGLGIDWMNGISLPGLYWLLATVGTGSLSYFNTSINNATFYNSTVSPPLASHQAP